MELELTDHAIEDLRGISQYTLRQWGAIQEQRYLKGLYAKFTEITLDSARWRFRHDLFPECQFCHYGRHVILFIITNEQLTVVRILHSSMDVTTQNMGDFE